MSTSRNEVSPAVKLLALVAMGFAPMGCASGGGDSGTWDGSVTDSGGVTVVHNGSGTVWADGGWGFREMLDIGVAEGDPHYQFGIVAAVDVASDGSILVLDQQARQVRAFSRRGEFSHVVATPGEGPGELGANASGLFVTAGDTVAVVDTGHQRVNLYSLAGESLGSIPLPFEQGIPVAVRMDRDQRLLVQQLRRFSAAGAQQTPSIDSLDRITRRRLDGETVDTVMSLPAGQTFSATGVITLFSPESIWSLDRAGGIVVGVNDRYRLTRHDVSGEPVLVFTMDIEPEPVSASDREVYTEAIIRLIERQGVPAQAAQSFRQRLSFADHHPAFIRILSGPDSTIWVQRPRVASTLSEEELEDFDPRDMGGGAWDVFGSDGKRLGTATFPDGFGPLVFRDGMAYGVRRDELDVDHVVALRVIDGNGDPVEFDADGDSGEGAPGG